ncbi:MAG TPA: hypothetical protein VEK12_08670, partial [Alphaproteobacteria bacterium]|nr:hypothetical protein [Alphaproteobacteria bacterium]
MLAATRGLLWLLLLCLAALSATAEAAPRAAAAETVAASIRGAHLAEPLVATAPTTAAEDQALVEALAAYEQRSAPGDTGSLTGFLQHYPHSGWAPALLTDLGLIYLHDGYFSRALDAWSEAWHEGKDATEPQA